MIKVFGTKVLIEVLQPEQERGYAIPSTAQANSNIGRVAYVGEKVENPQPGDIVVFPEYGSQEMEIVGKEYIVFNEPDDLICKIIKENE